MIKSLGLNETERLVRDSVTDCVSDIAGAGGTARAQGHGALSSLAKLGVLAAPLSENLGGMGEGLGTAMLVLEPLGRKALVTPYVEKICVPAAVAEFYPGHEDLRKHLESAANAGPGAVMAWVEAGRGWNRIPKSTTARREADAWRLEGRKSLVRWGDQAAAFIVTSKVDDEPALFLVAADLEGVEIKSYPSGDGRVMSDIVFHNVQLPNNSRMDDGNARQVIEYALDAGSALSLAEAVGLMDGSLEMTVDYLKTREQFGTALSKMQVLQHRLVEMYASTECAWSLAHEAASSLARDVPPKSRACAVSRAKAYIGRMGRFVGQEALQMHGAIGMTEEYPLGRYLQRLTAIDLDYGDSDWHLSRLSNVMQEID
ncbi:acyl-CoA dehydrogenase [Shinella daejeonensis]|uniref:acyl-CoA dehydrogenase family protein n=1 Tax=Shinella daejeonensis TaxID=659017 RepID=UPI0020C809CA|nr:acyl-CoA dehydrogenase [Shinella daejeonensis]MCP8894965.1 acyl-CoA dehydrogenase [Shinella daejeonensis]